VPQHPFPRTPNLLALVVQLPSSGLLTLLCLVSDSQFLLICVLWICLLLMLPPFVVPGIPQQGLEGSQSCPSNNIISPLIEGSCLVVSVSKKLSSYRIVLSAYQTRGIIYNCAWNSTCIIHESMYDSLSFWCCNKRASLWWGYQWSMSYQYQGRIRWGVALGWRYEQPPKIFEGMFKETFHMPPEYLRCPKSGLFYASMGSHNIRPPSTKSWIRPCILLINL